jgi:hypothetical protein
MHHNSSRVIELLMSSDSSGQSLQIADCHHGRTPLHAALKFGVKREVLQSLIDRDEAKTTLAAQDNRGRTPLVLAIELCLPKP